MVVLDSSCWISLFKADPGSEIFREAARNTSDVIVPTICLFEVSKILSRSLTEEKRFEALARMHRSPSIPVDATLALDGAGLSMLHRLPMADALILASARRHGAELWTRDAHFREIEGVRYFGS